MEWYFITLLVVSVALLLATAAGVVYLQWFKSTPNVHQMIVHEGKQILESWQTQEGAVLRAGVKAKLKDLAAQVALQDGDIIKLKGRHFQVTTQTLLNLLKNVPQFAAVLRENVDVIRATATQPWVLNQISGGTAELKAQATTLEGKLLAAERLVQILTADGKSITAQITATGHTVIQEVQHGAHQALTKAQVALLAESKDIEDQWANTLVPGYVNQLSQKLEAGVTLYHQEKKILDDMVVGIQDGSDTTFWHAVNGQIVTKTAAEAKTLIDAGKASFTAVVGAGVTRINNSITAAESTLSNYANHLQQQLSTPNIGVLVNGYVATHADELGLVTTAQLANAEQEAKDAKDQVAQLTTRLSGFYSMAQGQLLAGRMTHLETEISALQAADASLQRRMDSLVHDFLTLGFITVDDSVLEQLDTQLDPKYLPHFVPLGTGLSGAVFIGRSTLRTRTAVRMVHQSTEITDLDNGNALIPMWTVSHQTEPNPLSLFVDSAAFGTKDEAARDKLLNRSTVRVQLLNVTGNLGTTGGTVEGHGVAIPAAVTAVCISHGVTRFYPVLPSGQRPIYWQMTTYEGTMGAYTFDPMIPKGCEWVYTQQGMVMSEPNSIHSSDFTPATHSATYGRPGYRGTLTYTASAKFWFDLDFVVFSRL